MILSTREFQGIVLKKKKVLIFLFHRTSYGINNVLHRIAREYTIKKFWFV
jgi:hypothetical protein